MIFSLIYNLIFRFFKHTNLLLFILNAVKITSLSFKNHTFSVTLAIIDLTCQKVGDLYLFTIMLIEDDATLFSEIKERLAQWSYNVYGVQSFDQVFQEFTAIKPDLVVIDIQLPKFDGFHWCRIIRSHSNVPIIFLSSRDHPTDMVMSMQLGADDFVQKPFHFDVLIAKIQAILRRVYNYNTERIELRTWRGATIEYVKNTISNEQGTIELTKNEMLILKILTEHKNQIVSREKLIQNLWDNEHFVSDNTLTVNVNRLRKKLETIGLDIYIETKVGQGYIATEEVSV